MPSITSDVSHSTIELDYIVSAGLRVVVEKLLSLKKENIIVDINEINPDKSDMKLTYQGTVVNLRIIRRNNSDTRIQQYKVSRNYPLLIIVILVLFITITIIDFAVNSSITNALFALSFCLAIIYLYYTVKRRGIHIHSEKRETAKDLEVLQNTDYINNAIVTAFGDVEVISSS